MKKNFFISLGAVMLFVMISFTGAEAEIVRINGVLNAGWWANDLNGPYLNIRDSDTDTYIYQWSYSPPGTALLWTDFDVLVADLNDTENGLTVNNWVIESGGDPFNAPSSTILTSGIELSAGTYNISLAENSHAYDLAAFWADYYSDSNDNISMWNAYVQIWADYGNGEGASFNFGEGDWSFASEAAALEHYSYNVDGMEITLAYDADLYFYLNDYCSLDNGGSITLDIQSCSVPVPGTLYLLFSGLGMLIFKRRSRCN